MSNPHVTDSTSNLTEGYLPHGTHPLPGPRRAREVWRGHPSEQETSVMRRAARSRVRPHATPVPSHLAGTNKLGKNRVEGIDIARGFALIGMILVHTFPMDNEDGSQTWSWLLFSGKSAPLFAVLAGVSLAFMTGGSKPFIRSRLSWSKKSIVVRSLLLLVIGLAVNTLLAPAAENILPYYALMFLMTLPFIGMRIRSLLFLSLGVAVFAPMLSFVVQKFGGFTAMENAGFVELAHDPVGTLVNYLFVGTYPMAVWLAFTLLGMALGRMALHTSRVQWGILLSGVVATVSSYVVAQLFMRWLPTHKLLLDAVGGAPENGRETINEYLVFGASEQEVYTSSPIWLFSNGPHMNTPVSTIQAAGLACTAIGALSLATRFLLPVLRPLAMVGSMTLTLYLAHIIGLGFLEDAESTSERYWLQAAIQLGVAFGFAYLWRVWFASGPLEKVVTVASKGGATALSDGAPPKGNAQRRIYFSHSYRFDPTKGEV